MNMFKSLGVIILMSVLINAYCSLENQIVINDVYISNAFPTLGEKINITIEIESNNYVTSPIRIYLDEGYFKQIIIEDEIYISKGKNNYVYEVQVPKNMGHNVGIFEIEINGFYESLPIIVDNNLEIISEVEEEETYSLVIKTENPIKIKDESGSLREVTIKPVDGIATLIVAKCNDCERFFSFELNEEKYRIYKKWGEYVRPYSYISGINNNQIEIIECPSEEITIKSYETGYEKIKLENSEFDLNKFITEEKNEIVVLNDKPLTFKIIAIDDLNRKVKSNGTLLLECEANNYIDEIEFNGEIEKIYNFGIDTICNITYNEITKKSNVALKVDKQTEDIKEDVIYIEDYIKYGFIILSVILAGVLLYKWRGLRKK